jgi:cytochrome o ubiquinol oxidase operon protein cyoD
MNKLKNEQAASWGTEMTYITGFGLSLGLTLVAYLLVKRHLSSHHIYPSDNFMLVGLSILATVQFIVQLIFFLHLDRESKPRWNLTVLLGALVVVGIIVAGSIWIMYHLNYNMSPEQQNHYLLKQDGGI